MTPRRGMRAILSLAGCVSLLAIAAGAQAQLNFFSHQQGVIQPDENVLMDSSSGMNVFGHTNNSNVSVIFTSNEDIIAPAQGQARVEAADGVGYKSLCFQLATGEAFTELEFNVNVAQGEPDGTITFQVFGSGAGVPSTFTSNLDANGSNFFDFQALGNTQITKVCFTTDVNVIDTRQWRVGGVGPLNVPESSSMALLATGLVPLFGLVMKRRKKAA